MSRVERVAQQLKREISSIILQEIDDPRIGFLTVTNVKVSPDLRVAKVYYTILGDQGSLEKAKEGLESASPYIRRLIAQRMRLKFVPEIRFYPDEELDKRLRVERILDELRHEGEEEGQGGDTQEG